MGVLTTSRSGVKPRAQYIGKMVTLDRHGVGVVPIPLVLLYDLARQACP
jgi:hypothetical protein